jgi:soluble lytic murein transglycosylase-like protein
MYPRKVPMKKLFTFLFFFSLSFASLPAQSQTQRLTSEKTALVNWVFENSTHPVSFSKALKIVSSAIRFSEKQNLDPLLVLAMIKVESGFKDTARSGYGAKGLMQVVPRWHRDKLKGRNPYDTDVSVEVGTQVLKDCLDKRNGRLATTLACYSGGAKLYYHKVAYNHTHMTKAIVEYQFEKEENINVRYLGLIEKAGYVNLFAQGEEFESNAALIALFVN